MLAVNLGRLTLDTGSRRMDIERHWDAMGENIPVSNLEQPKYTFPFGIDDQIPGDRFFIWVSLVRCNIAEKTVTVNSFPNTSSVLKIYMIKK